MGFTLDFSEFDRLKNAYSDMKNDFNQFLRSFLIEMAQPFLLLRFYARLEKRRDYLRK